MGEFLRRLHYLVNRRRLERELANDIEFHREMSGKNAVDFGNTLRLQEQAHEVWGWGWLDRTWQDLRFGLRLLRKSPTFALTAILVLGLGIGVNVTMFNILDVMFFKPLPVRQPLSLVHLTTEFPQGSSSNVAYPAAMFYRDHNHVLSAVLTQTTSSFTLTDGQIDNLKASLVSANYFSELGGGAEYGRLFNPKSDAAPDAPAVVVLGHGFFERRFGGDPSVVGRTIHLNQRPATVIGIVPAGFVGLDPEMGEKADVWVAMEQLTYFVPDTKLLTDFDQFSRTAAPGVRMYGRLLPQVGRQQAEQALAIVSEELVKQHPDVMFKGEHLAVAPGGYGAEFNANALPIFALLLSLVALVLGTACGNLGNLLLGHAMARGREMAIRLSLGASRLRIVRQLMTESFFLAVAGSCVGLLMSWLVSRWVVMKMGGPGNFDYSPDWRTTLFSFTLGTLACLFFGLPAARMLSKQVHKIGRTRTIFMGVQVAASCVLLIISGLLVRALDKAFRSGPGFDYEHVIMVDPQLYAHAFKAPEARRYMDELKARMQQVPGVDAVSLVLNAPLGHNIEIQRAKPGTERTFDVYINHVESSFFQVMNVPVERGRTFGPDDRYVAILGSSAVRRLWPDKDPLQQLYKFNDKKLTVVGVVSEARMMNLRDANAGQLYLALPEKELPLSQLLVRTSRPPEEVIGQISALARNLDPEVGPEIGMMKDSYDNRMGESAKVASFSGGLGVLAALLAAIGLYGVVAFNVAQRTKEIGIRIALGSPGSFVVGNVVSGYFRPMIISMVVGVGTAGSLSMVLRNQLFGLSNLDPASYLIGVALLAASGAVAALVPARRALRVDPITALRCE